ncbi:Arginyl-tRNA--protein transferase 1 [Actinomortierella wolfii]|nr:Arginyl-tRNA--protein transferase 1 [Actinomortierella wolfii]
MASSMEALNFRASKHQRNLVNRFNRFVSKEGDATFEREIQAQLKEKSSAKKDKADSSAKQNANTAASTNSSAAKDLCHNTATDATSEPTLSEADAKAQAKAEAKLQKQKQKKVLKEMPKTHVDKIHLAEYLLHPEQTEWSHRFKVKLEPASFTPEKHEVYVKYQVGVHGDDPSDVQPTNFKNFLVRTPLKATKPDTWTEQDPGYGSFHQCYYLDDKLIAVSVIDILPSCVSAVYFFYDPDYSALSLGKYSAQREIALVQELHQNPEYESLQYYYMGFYIFTCPKMSYKAQYEPSLLLDPETYTWVEIEKCKQILGDKRYSSWIHPEELDPLFEEQVQLIRNTKRDSRHSSKKKSTKDEDDDEDDQWDDVDSDDDMDEDLDPDEFMEKAVEGSDSEHELAKDDSHQEGEAGNKKPHGVDSSSNGEDDKSIPRKRAKQDDPSSSAQQSASQSVEKSEDEEKKKKELARKKKEEGEAHAKKRKQVYDEVTSRRPPGWLDPKKIGNEELMEVLCLNSNYEIQPIVLSSVFKKRKEVRDMAAEYYAAIGKELASRMIVFFG